MTGGTEEAENINAQLAIAAEELKIPIGVGSQRQALENQKFRNTYHIIRKNAKISSGFRKSWSCRVSQTKIN